MGPATLVGPHGDLFDEALVQAHLAPPFIERRWLARRVERHFSDEQCRFILVTGAAGVGKSTFAAWLTTLHEISPRYFIRVGSLMRNATVDANELLMSIGFQLAGIRPGLFSDERPLIQVDTRVGHAAKGSRQTGVRVKHLAVNPFSRADLRVTQRTNRLEGESTAVEAEHITADPRLLDPERLQHLALIGPARRLLELDAAARIVLIVDALDELELPSVAGYSIADWLAACPELPPNVRVVVTSRPHQDLRMVGLRQQARVRTEELDPSEAEAVRDLRAYAAKVAEDATLARVLRRHGLRLNEVARKAAEQAAGNFLYLVTWTRAITSAAEDGHVTEMADLADMSVLPAGELDALYEVLITYSRRRSGASAWGRVYLPLLATLSVARAALAPADLIAWSGLSSDDETRDALHGLRQLLTTGPSGTCKLFHGSIGQFLNSAGTREHRHRSEYYIDPMEQHRRMADRLIAEYGNDWSLCSHAYALDHVAGHLIAVLAAQDADDGVREHCSNELARLFEDRGYIAQRHTRAGAHPLIVDALIAYRTFDSTLAPQAHRLTKALADHALAGEAGLPSAPLNANDLHATLAYRDDAGSFYDAVLAHATSEEAIRGLVHPAVASSVRTAFLHLRAGRLRRAGDVALAERLVDEVLADETATAAARSRHLYDQAYSCFLRGDAQAAHVGLLRSADAALEAGDYVAHWVSRLIAHQVAYYQGVLAASDYRQELLSGLGFLNSVDRTSGSLAERWLMNCHAHLFDLAVLEGDVVQAEEQWEVLRDDAWVDRSGRSIYRGRWEARRALLHEQWARACDAYEDLLGSGVLREDPVRDNEGTARDLLDFGRALQGAGRHEEARQAWRQALRTPDHTAAWPWKPQARLLLHHDRRSR